MWWKLVGLAVLTAVLVFVVIPIRTHAVIYDPMTEPPLTSPSFGEMLGNMYLTPNAALLILIILTMAGFIAFKIVRGRW